MILQDLRKEKQGQKGERNKTIILLRVSTIPQPPKVARGQRSGSVGQLVKLSNKKPQRTQQNDRGFVALAGRGQLEDGRSQMETMYQVYNFRIVKRAKIPRRGAGLRLTSRKTDR